MAKVVAAVPNGYTSWNDYIKKTADATPVDIDARRALKRAIKLGQIASVERFAGGVITSPSYRVRHVYDSVTNSLIADSIG
jgi:hypothetical protein